MIYAKAMPYSDPLQVGKYYVLWSGSQPMTQSIGTDGTTTEVPDTTFSAYNVADSSHLDASSGTIVVI